MPPPKRKGERPRAKGDASDVTTDDVRGPPPLAPPRIRHTESEVSSAEEMESAKRPKTLSPRTRRAAAVQSTPSGVVDEAVRGVVAKGAPVSAQLLADEVEVIAVGQLDTGVASGAGTTASERKPRSRRRESAADNLIEEVKGLANGMMRLVMVEGVDRKVAQSVLEQSAKYEVVLMKLIAENERLRGRIESGAAAKPVGMQVAAPMANSRAPVAVRPVPPTAYPALPVVRPVETWSVVVRGQKGKTSKEVVEKVVSEVGPTLGVRVHEVRAIKDGAIIRTPSEAERRKIAENRKFSEVGLEVAVPTKLGPKIMVQRVHGEISPDEFMEELYSLNLGDMMTPATFKKSVRIASAPWKAGDRAVNNITLEVTQDIAEHLRSTGVYIKWFRFIVRVLDAVPACYRCLGFDHRVRDCRFKSDICRRCGAAGHVSNQCPNELRCRDCAFKGLQADHLMMSAACPVYASMVARVNARH